MTNSGDFRGVLVPVLTPFRPRLDTNPAAFVKHCQWLLDEGADGLAIFGTTSEANSLATEEKIELLESLLAAGVSADKLMPGTGTCSLTDTVRLTAHAVKQGCRGLLMLPPFYYKDVSEDGLFASFAEVIERVADSRLRVYLYHIPPVSAVPISMRLIERLLATYPETVVGLKDSSGDWSNTLAVLEGFPQLATFAGSEVFLLDTLRHGGAGCITATGNVNPGGIRSLYQHWRDPQAEALQTRISEIRTVIQSFPMIPALKAIAGRFYTDPDWRIVRPPLTALDDARGKSLTAALDALQFSMGTYLESV